jgi:hypothetical protein
MVLDYDKVKAWLGGSEMALKVHNLTLANFLAILTIIKP